MAGCAKCGGELEQTYAGNTPIDTCPSCGGIWFDLDELFDVAELGKGDQERLPECLLAGGPPREDWGLDPAFCPRCGAPLKPQRFDVELPVVLDYCPRGHGVWLDKGEFAEVNRFFDRIYNKLFPGRKELSHEEAAAIAESNERLLATLDVLGKVGCAAVAAAGAYLLHDAIEANPCHAHLDHAMVSRMFSPAAVSCATSHARRKRLKWSS